MSAAQTPAGWCHQSSSDCCCVFAWLTIWVRFFVGYTAAAIMSLASYCRQKQQCADDRPLLLLQQRNSRVIRNPIYVCCHPYWLDGFICFVVQLPETRFFSSFSTRIISLFLFSTNSSRLVSGSFIFWFLPAARCGWHCMAKPPCCMFILYLCSRKSRSL